MSKDIYAFRDYKGYLKARFQSLPKQGRGARKAMAEALGCPTSHISQVLSGSSHFTMEQAEGVNQYLGHTEDEAQFFFLLIHFARAGTPSLRSRLNKQIQSVQQKRLVLKDRLGVKEGLSKEDQTKFYSSWVYGAIHVLLAAKKFQTKETISNRLGISMKRTSEILEFLVQTGLAKPLPGHRFEIGTARIHLGNDSDLISKFHTNWRVQAIRSLDKESVNEDLHYSSAISISEADFLRIKGMLVKAIEEIKPVIRDSEAEDAYSFSIDFFGL